MPGQEEPTIRQRLEELFALLREAATAALTRHAVVASKLDESRSELERLLMLEIVDERDAQRAITRGKLLLDAWRGMVAVPVPSRSRSQ